MVGDGNRVSCKTVVLIKEETSVYKDTFAGMIMEASDIKQIIYYFSDDYFVIEWKLKQRQGVRLQTEVFE
jgi:hypothetical protein